MYYLLQWQGLYRMQYSDRLERFLDIRESGVSSPRNDRGSGDLTMDTQVIQATLDTCVIRVVLLSDLFTNTTVLTQTCGVHYPRDIYVIFLLCR